MTLKTSNRSIIVALCLALATTTFAAPSPQVLRCTVEGESSEWFRIDANQWQEWDEGRWSGNLCGREASGHKAYEAWRCRTGGDVRSLDYSAADHMDRGVYRRVDSIDLRTGAFHRRIVDSTYILSSGSRLEFNHYGHCVVSSEPLPQEAPDIQ